MPQTELAKCLEGLILSRHLLYLTTLAALAVIGLYRFFRLSTPTKWISVYAIVVFLAEILRWFIGCHYQNGNPVHHFFIPAHLVFFGIIYFSWIQNFRQTRWFLLGVSVCMALFLLANALFFQSIYSFPSLGLLFLNMFAVVCSLLLFYDMLKSPKEFSIFKLPAFWFNSSNLFFYSITFFLFSFIKNLQATNSELPSWGYNIIWIANLILYAFYAIAIILDILSNSKKR